MSNSTTDNCHIQRFSVSFEYPVHFTRDVLSTDNDLLCQAIDRLQEGRLHRLQIFIDSGVARAFPHINQRIEDYIAARPDKLSLVCPPQIVPGGEQAKNSRDITDVVIKSIANQHLCRQSCVIAIGGGSVLDIVGLAASLVHRGIRLIRIPTTVLAQNDSGVGVKNGVDAYGAKNLVGTFAPPFAVLIDPDFLTTLEDKYWTGGIAESFKVAIIKDAKLFNFLCTNASALQQRDFHLMEELVQRTAIIHMNHIMTAGDPFEMGSSRPLDFGHWAAHRLEVLSNYDIGHGQAVSIGIAIDSFIAFRLDMLSQEEMQQIITSLSQCGLPVWSDLLLQKTPSGGLDLIRGIEDFREHLGGELCITLPDGIGAKKEIHTLDASLITDAIAFLQNRPSSI